MGYIPDKMVEMVDETSERAINISDEIKGKSGDEVIDKVREQKTIKLD
jgi:hypothetical protein